MMVAAQKIAPNVFLGMSDNNEMRSPYISKAEMVTISIGTRAKRKRERSILIFSMDMKIRAGVPV